MWHNEIMPPTARTKRRKKRVLKTTAERQREIVDVTIQLLHEHGIDGTSVSRIAERVGMSKGALYYHFPNHEALLVVALTEMNTVATSWFTESSGGDVPSSLLAMGEAHAKWALSVRNSFLRPLYQLIASGQDSALNSLVRATKDDLFQRVIEFAEEGKREGTIRNDVDSRELAWCVFLFLWGEDVAALQGDFEFITEGESQRLLHRLLEPYFVSPV